MAFITEAQALAAAPPQARTVQLAEAEFRKAAAAAEGQPFDVFLSHSSLDARMIAGIKRILEAEGISVYVDWLVDPQLDRSHVTPATARTIARALALKPTLLLFDEPTSSLDPESTGEVLRVMRELAAEGMTMLLVTHELPFAQEVSDWVVFIDGGRIIEEGPPAEVFQRPREERTKAYVANYASHFEGGLDEAQRVTGLTTIAGGNPAPHTSSS